MSDGDVLDGSIGAGYFDYLVEGFLGSQHGILDDAQIEALKTLPMQEKQQFVLDALSDATWCAIDADVSAAVLERVGVEYPDGGL